MKISYKWLIELTGIDWSPEELAERLTASGTACEYIEYAARYMDKVVVGEVTDLRAIEGASKIRLATVNLGDQTMDVVCGAPNVDIGQKVAVALEGAKLVGNIVIKKTKIRGVESRAMICSERELGISDDHSGILVLEPCAPVGTPIAEYLDYDDHVLTFELTPNRPDSMSAIGIARDIAALASTKVRKPTFDLKEVAENASNAVTVRIEDTEGCPRYAARVIKNVKVEQSPWWIRKKLIMAGVRPISNVVDITNLVMLETGHPLHAFDLDRFGSSEVVVRKANNSEKFTTLDGKEHELTPDVLLISNGKEGVAAGGVMGGLESEVENTTTNILLEAAYFSPATIRRSRKKLGIVSESSSRFEKGADPNGIAYAIDRAADLLQSICGGEVLTGIVDCYPGKINPKKVTLRTKRCNDILGSNFSGDKIGQVLEGLEFQVVKGDGIVEATIPTFRPDIEREIDLIEEVARIAGYDKIPDANRSVGSLFTPIHYEDKFRSEMRQLLVSSGFDEMIHHGLVDSKLASALNPEKAQVKIANPVSEDLGVMRNCLAQTALGVASHNIARRNLDLALFEIGKVYFPPEQGSEWVEKYNLVLLVSGESERSWRDRPRQQDFYDLSGAIERLGRHFGWKQITYAYKVHSYLDNDISFDILCGGKTIGTIGKILPQIAKKFDIKQNVYLAEICIESLIEESGHLKEYKPLPIFPAAPRDLAIVVDEHVKAADLTDIINSIAGDFAESIEIFDLYTGQQIEKGKKSIAISIIFRSAQGNLESGQVDEWQSAIADKLKRQLNAQIRDK